MRIWGLSALALVAIGCSGATGDGEVIARPQDTGTRVAGGGEWSGRYTVVFRTDSLPSDAASRIAKAGGSVVNQVADAGVLVAKGDSQFAAKLASDPTVLAVGAEQYWKAPKVTTTADEASPQTIGGPTAADWASFYQWDIRRVNAPAAWARVPLEKQATVTVAVLDVGVMDNHPDLAGQVVDSVGTNYCGYTAGYPAYPAVIDATLPVPDCSPAPLSFEFHGTHVAGTIAAKFGGGIVTGVAPGLRLAAYKVFDHIRIPTPNGPQEIVAALDGPIFAAIDDASRKGYRVINMSLGGNLDRTNKDQNTAYLAWDRVAKLANRRGTLIVAAAGNETLDSNGTTTTIPSDLPTVMSVSATGTSQMGFDPNAGLVATPGSDVLTFYSNYGSAVDIAAPGGDCGPNFPQSCDPRYLILSSVILPNGAPSWGFAGGTSMASPHVAAVAGLAFATHAGWGPGDVRSRLKDSAKYIGPRQSFGAGMVDADAASW